MRTRGGGGCGPQRNGGRNGGGSTCDVGEYVGVGVTGRSAGLHPGLDALAQAYTPALMHRPTQRPKSRSQLGPTLVGTEPKTIAYG